MKQNVAEGFIRKVFRLSHSMFWKENINRIKKILEKNSYPNNIINSLIHKVCKKRSIKLDTTQMKSYPFLSSADDTHIKEKTTNNEAKQYAALSYVPLLSEAISKSCQYFTPNVKLAMRPQNKINNMFSKLKHPLKKEENSGLVYKIDCDNCPVTYIGETIQKLGERVKQHEYDCKKPTEQINRMSALAKHATFNNHTFKTNDPVILKRERNKFKLQIHEVNQIIRFENTACNDKSDKKDYTTAYHNLICTNNKS